MAARNRRELRLVPLQGGEGEGRGGTTTTTTTQQNDALPAAGGSGHGPGGCPAAPRAPPRRSVAGRPAPHRPALEVGPARLEGKQMWVSAAWIKPPPPPPQPPPACPGLSAFPLPGRVRSPRRGGGPGKLGPFAAVLMGIGTPMSPKMGGGEKGARRVVPRRLLMGCGRCPVPLPPGPSASRVQSRRNSRNSMSRSATMDAISACFKAKYRPR